MYIYIYIYMYIYIQISDTCTTVSTVLPIVSVWDPRKHYKIWYIGSVLWVAWWWLSRAETCCNENILFKKLLCLTGKYTLYAYTNECKHTVQNCLHTCLPEDEPMRFETFKRRQNWKKINYNINLSSVHFVGLCYIMISQ